ncbi:MAG: hypothetical protein L6R40_001483 [Gallowayella cf. fulva]|nr:MAG: hypothetical protein L6R40_001483 [Xanthomendoza cf. fulva]
MNPAEQESKYTTRVLPVDADELGTFTFSAPNKSFLGDWDLRLSENSQDAVNLLQAVKQLQTSSVPVAFPTETVYGLGADATRSDAVAGIYAAKCRPADNPLIIHISSLRQLRKLLESTTGLQRDSPDEPSQQIIPAIYHPLISRFWPGPLTLLLPLPHPSPFAPAVTGSLSTFGVRMPSSRLALALIHLAGVPLAAPSANASTKPSPTTAAHVLHDLAGRIDLIVDGGPCMVGVESTVVDGLTTPPVILRPGGVSIEMLRQCPGWEDVAAGYKDSAEITAPRAPGMKYKHYSPRARVILVHGRLSFAVVTRYLQMESKIGLAKTKTWRDVDLIEPGRTVIQDPATANSPGTGDLLHRFVIKICTTISPSDETCRNHALNAETREHTASLSVSSINLGIEITTIAQGLFSALRELDQEAVDVIFVEAINETEGDAAAAVMNRLRKAAETEIES